MDVRTTHKFPAIVARYQNTFLARYTDWSLRKAGSSDQPAAWFAYSPDRQGKHPQYHLRHHHGVLQADAFAGYDRLFSAERDGGPLIEAACWAHPRRKIHDVYISTQTATAEEALKHIGELYAMERKYATSQQLSDWRPDAPEVSRC